MLRGRRKSLSSSREGVPKFALMSQTFSGPLDAAPRPLSPEQQDAQATLTQLILEEGLEAQAAEIAQVTEPIVILVTRKAVRADLALGASRLGGEPDLTPGSAWPEHNGVPLPFLAQLRLEDVAPHDVHRVLPQSGLLSFFARSLTAGHVRFAPQGSMLERRELPEAIDEEDRTFAWGFDIKGEVSIPEADYPDLCDQLREALGYGFNSHQLLGSVEDLPGFELLLAINSDDNAGLNFGGEMMRQCFCIARESLRSLDFSQVLVRAG